LFSKLWVRIFPLIRATGHESAIDRAPHENHAIPCVKSKGGDDIQVYSSSTIQQAVKIMVEKKIGVISGGDVTKACLTEKTAEREKLNPMVSGEYYENWRQKSRLIYE
jgi:hypothetical protein